MVLGEGGQDGFLMVLGWFLGCFWASFGMVSVWLLDGLGGGWPGWFFDGFWMVLGEGGQDGFLMDFQVFLVC